MAEDREYADELERHRMLLDEWIKQTNDPGAESDDVYVLETEDQLKGVRSEASRKTYRSKHRDI